MVTRAETEAQKEKGTLVLVADGMGGHSAGEVASSMAVQLITQVYYEDDGSPRDALSGALAGGEDGHARANVGVLGPVP